MRTKLIYSKLTEKVLGCAIKAHRNLGSGFLEKIYEEALCLELTRAGLPFERQVRLTIKYLSIRRFANSITRLNAETQKSGNAEEVIKLLRKTDSTLHHSGNQISNAKPV